MQYHLDNAKTEFYLGFAQVVLLLQLSYIVLIWFKHHF